MSNTTLGKRGDHFAKDLIDTVDGCADYSQVFASIGDALQIGPNATAE
jgi:hypothetical protein